MVKVVKILIIVLMLIILGFSIREYTIYKKSRESNIALYDFLECRLGCEYLTNLTTGEDYLDPECFGGCLELTVGLYTPPRRYNGFDFISKAESCRIRNQTFEQREMCASEFFVVLEERFSYLGEN